MCSPVTSSALKTTTSSGSSALPWGHPWLHQPPVFMGGLEAQLPASSPVPVSQETWKRFIDDIFLLWTGTPEDLDVLQTHQLFSSHYQVHHRLLHRSTALPGHPDQLRRRLPQNGHPNQNHIFPRLPPQQPHVTRTMWSATSPTASS